MVQTSPNDIDTFERPALWRAEIIDRFRLRGAERCAAASPAPGYPQLLESLLSDLDGVPKGVWLDVGGGLGGVASWIERKRQHQVVVIDAAVNRLRAARRLFPTVPAMVGDAHCLPVVTGTSATTMLSGVLSLDVSIEPVLREVARVLQPSGRAVFSDLWSSTASMILSPPNTFRVIEDVQSCAAEHGLRSRHVAVADATSGWWSEAATQVNDEIERSYRHLPEFARWKRDHGHIRAALESGNVVAAGLVLERSGP